jgi:hypothetical protein
VHGKKEKGSPHLQQGLQEAAQLVHTKAAELCLVQPASRECKHTHVNTCCWFRHSPLPDLVSCVQTCRSLREGHVPSAVELAQPPPLLSAV